MQCVAHNKALCIVPLSCRDIALVHVQWPFRETLLEKCCRMQTSSLVGQCMDEQAQLAAAVNVGSKALLG